MQLGIVGFGVVGRAMARLFSRESTNQVCVYDKYLPEYSSPGNMDAVDACDLVFVAVPTPTGVDGYSADVSAVVESVTWISAPICIRSTIPAGTTDHLVRDTAKQIAFSPAYIGEAMHHPWQEEDSCGYLIIGGDSQIADTVCRAYRSVVPPNFRYAVTDPTTAELCKYMENCFLATKVAFVNQFYDIAVTLGVDFEVLRSLWLMDSRIGDSHTLVTTERGFGGRCLPKDMRAIVSLMRAKGSAPLLEAVLSFNDMIRTEQNPHSETPTCGHVPKFDAAPRILGTPIEIPIGQFEKD
jgi:UDPglucose 6-dehydrogenase